MYHIFLLLFNFLIVIYHMKKNWRIKLKNKIKNLNKFAVKEQEIFGKINFLIFHVKFLLR